MRAEADRRGHTARTVSGLVRKPYVRQTENPMPAGRNAEVQTVAQETAAKSTGQKVGSPEDRRPEEDRQGKEVGNPKRTTGSADGPRLRDHLAVARYI